MKKASIACVLLLVSAFKFCEPKPAPSSSSAPATQPGDFGRPNYVRRTNADTVIVFVHGVFGGSVGTWTNQQTKAYWPNLILDDDSFKNTDVYVYSFSTPYLAQSYTIDELIENMRLIFASDEVFQKHKRVIFLCHSMGGLVVRGFLKRYQTYAPKVPLIYFFSTPTAGAHITELARFLTKNPQLRGMLPADSDSYVANLQRDWRALPYRVNSRCAYEKLDTFGVKIVDEQSASALCDGPVDPINANHIDIVKPRDRSDIPYLAFKQAITDLQQVVSATDNATKIAPEKPNIGSVRTARSVEVDCGQVRDDTTNIPPPIEVKPEQRIVDAVASLQEASNLKEQQVEAKGLENNMAKVHYRLVGPDRPAGGGCPAKGYGVILVTFVVSQPANMITVGFTPVAQDSLFLALASKSGTLAINRAGKIPPIDATHFVANASETLVLQDQVSVKRIEKF